LDTVGFWLKVIVKSSLEAAQGELLMVQRSTYVVPAVPLNTLVGLDGVVIAPPVPLTILHDPVPTAGVLPASDALVRPHMTDPVWSVPAFAAVGLCVKVIVTSSDESVQGELLIVHRNT